MEVTVYNLLLYAACQFHPEQFQSYTICLLLSDICMPGAGSGHLLGQGHHHNGTDKKVGPK